MKWYAGSNGRNLGGETRSSPPHIILSLTGYLFQSFHAFFELFVCLQYFHSEVLIREAVEVAGTNQVFRTTIFIH